MEVICSKKNYFITQFASKHPFHKKLQTSGQVELTDNSQAMR